MKRILLYILLFVQCSITTSSFAQSDSFSFLRKKKVPILEKTISLDTALIIPNSLLLINPYTRSRIDSTAFEFRNNLLYWRSPLEQLPDSVWMEYRILPFNLRKPITNLDTSLLKTIETDGKIIGLDYNPYQKEEDLIDFKGLNYNGSFARGISFGNSQDLVLNSRFNLQLAGDLGDGIEVLAAITDENIPLQPEGNTQQLREFDKIFIQLKKDNSKLIAGDYELRSPNNYFMKYFKKLQGATIQNEQAISEKGLLKTNASVAISRGKFAVNLLAQQEGNQGPYKLSGAEGERFIIVLAGTEQVWIDGKLLKRGIEEDYTIDYNRGEITFTNKQLITKDTRPRVEFQYSDQSYLRSLYAINTSYEQKNWRVYLNLYNEQDSRTSTGEQDLSDTEKRILQAAGDNFQQAVISGIDSLEEFSALRPAYRLVDTLLDCGIRDSVLLFDTNPATAIYNANFSFVGVGNGNYELDPTQAANGRVYRWSPPNPTTCQPTGSYEPIIQLTAPEQLQLFNLGMEVQLSNTASIQSEIALSKNDQNRFSRLDSDDDFGLASFNSLQKYFQLGKDSSGWSIDTKASFEWVQSNFRSLNPYRTAEFARDWNIATTPSTFTEQIGRASFTLQKENWARLQYQISQFDRRGNYIGTKHDGLFRFNRPGWLIQLEGGLLLARDTIEQSTFFRPKVNVIKSFPRLKNWQIGFYGEREKNDRLRVNSDTLLNTSFYYDMYRLFVQSPAQKKFTFGTKYTKRLDYAPVHLDFDQNTVAEELNVNGNWNIQRALQLAGNLTYRQLEVVDSSLTNQSPAETFLGRVDLNFNLFKGAIRSTSTYEIGSGQEPRLEFQYIEVDAGRGTHIWLDSLFNNDGVWQEFEMAIAPYPDQANFIKVATFSDQFIRTNNASLNQSWNINPKAIWFKEKKGIKKALSKFSLQSTLRINRKTREAPEVAAWNPFQLAIPDSALVSLNASSRNILFFNRSHPSFDIQLTNLNNRNRIVQTTGFESRSNLEQSLKLRWNTTRQLSLRMTAGLGTRTSDSEFFDSKDFQIEYVKLAPEITYLPKKEFRAILSYTFQNDENTLPNGGERAVQHDFSLSTTYNRTATTSIRTNISLVNINFTGEANSPVGFAMLNGLQKGQNYLWNISLDRRLAKNMQLSITYEGRKTGQANVVHVGRAQVAATF